MDEKRIIGIDIGGTTVKIAILDQKGSIHDKWSIKTNKQDNGQYILAEVAESIRKGLIENEISIRDVIGAGVGLPGFVDAKNGVIEFAANIGWKNYPVAKILEDKLGFPVSVENDANLAAAGEYWKGSEEKVDDLVLITLGTGIGAGIIINGTIINGKSNMAGEFGHTIVDFNQNRPCNCGKRGCLETVSSATGMIHQTLEGIEQNQNTLIYDIYKKQGYLTTKDLFICANKGDLYCIDIINEAMRYLGIAISNLANTLNPEKIVIGGGVTAGENLLSFLSPPFNDFALDRVGKETMLTISELGNDAGIIGAAWLANQQYIKEEVKLSV